MKNSQGVKVPVPDRPNTRQLLKGDDDEDEDRKNAAEMI